MLWVGRDSIRVEFLQPRNRIDCWANAINIIIMELDGIDRSLQLKLGGLMMVYNKHV